MIHYIDGESWWEWTECKTNNDKLYTPSENEYIADDFIILYGDIDSKEEDPSLPYVKYGLNRIRHSKIRLHRIFTIIKWV